MEFTRGLLFLCLFLVLAYAEAGKRRYFKYGGNWKSLRDQPLLDDSAAWSKSRTSFGSRRSLPDVRSVHQDARDVPEHTEVDLTCAVDRRTYPRIRWSRIGQPLPEHGREYDGRLHFRSIQLNDAGTYVCSASNDWDTREVHIKLTVQPANRYREQTGSFGQCGYDQATCRSGDCIDRSDICDGELDCRDGSDEANCGSRGTAYLDASRDCEPNEFKCGNGKCMQLMWRCDGDDDCGDNSDEQSCGARQPGEACAPWEFKCAAQGQCIPLAYQCDKTSDCFDGSDEVGCTGPTVVEPPKRDVAVRCGETIVLTCRTVGVPVPYVNWRLNWGPVCGPPRCTQSSVNGLGTLTIRNAQDIDQGAYTCEAVNVVNRLLVTPDAIVRVNCNEPIVRLTVTVDPKFQEIDEYSTARFRCLVQGGSGGPYTYTWTRLGYNHLPTNSRVEGDTLIIENAHIENYGTFVCSVSSPRGDRGSDQGELRVRRIGQCPYVWIEPDNQWRGQPGERVEFVCKAIGEPTPRIYWSRADGRPFDPNVNDDGNGRLVISNVNYKDFGVYVCTGENRAGKNTANATVGEGDQAVRRPVEGYRRSPISVRILPSNRIASKRHSTVIATCVASGDQPITISWTRVDGQPFANNVQDTGNGELRFLGIEKTNAGDYRCTARNPYDQAYDIATVLEPTDIKVTPPVVYIEPREIEGRPGDPGQFRCTAYGDTRDPPPRLTWRLYGGGALPADVEDQGNGVLSFPNLQQHHAGTYECVATTDYTRATATAPVRIRPHAGPTVWIEPVDRWAARPGDSFEFQCRASGDPPPQLTWSREDGKQLARNVQELNDGRLSLTAVNKDDAGRYICTAFNLAGTASAPATVNVEGGAPGQPVVSPPFQLIPDGQPAQFHCSSSGGYPPPTLTWGFQRERGQLKPGVRHEDGRLYIDRVSKEDAGQYICTATNEYGSASAPGTLQVAKAPTLRIDPDDKWDAKPGQDHDFTCVSVDDPEARLTWRRADGRPFDSNVQDHGDGRLSINNYSGRHDGQYICTGTSPGGTSEVPANVGPVKEPPPVPEVTPKIQTIPRGDSAEFECKVDANPPATLSWGFGSPNGALKSNARVESSGNRLVIESVSANDEGQYYCTATNPYGSNSAPGSLYVEEPPVPPKVTITPQKLWKGKKGEDFTFKCTATGHPDPEVRWTRENENDFDPNVNEEDDGRLVITNANLVNKGKYVCTATNSAGSDSDTAEVDLQPSVGVEVRRNGKPVESPIYLSEGEPLELECIGTGDPDPKIGWTVDMGPSRGDVPEGYKPVEIFNQFVRHDSFSRANEGVYKCNASNEFGTAEKMVRIVVAPPGKRQVVILGGSQRPTEVGTRLELRCVLPDTGPRFDLRWMKKSPSGTPIAVRHEQPSEGALVIPEFQRNDAGVYECQAWDEETKNVVSSADVTVSVTGEQDPLSVVEIEGHKIRALNAGETLELKCSAPAESPGIQSDLRWEIFDKNDFKPVTKGSNEDGTLRIPNVELSDGGIYKCVRYLGEDSDGANQVTVLVSNSETTAGKVNAEVGYATDVHCPLYPVSGMTYKWKRVNQPRLPSGVQPEGRTLRISTFKPEFAGTYECEGRLNGARARGYIQVVSEGALKLAAILRPIQAVPTQNQNRQVHNRQHHKAVAATPTTTTKPYMELQLEVTPDFVFPGQDVLFRCKVEGDPGARIRWERMDGQLPKNAFAHRNELRIKKVSKSDAGRYVCHANTKIGEMAAHANLKLGQKVSGNTLRRYYRLRT